MTVINTNIASLNAQRNLSSSQGALATSLQRLSSGLRVNSSKDDAAGLSIATRLDSQSRGFSVAARNANDAISLLQVSDGALATVTDHLQRMRELSVQSANGTNSADDRLKLKTEFDALSAEVTAVIGKAQFNNVSLLGGTATTFQVGYESGDTRGITISAVNALTALSDNIATDATAASAAITKLDADLATVNTARAEIGANLSKFERIVSDLASKRENADAAKSRIMDADYAQETAKLTRNQILQQAGTAMLAQANSMPNVVMSLLRG
jgi:flagellin